jgi:hypothetical protein
LVQPRGIGRPAGFADRYLYNAATAIVFRCKSID